MRVWQAILARSVVASVLGAGTATSTEAQPAPSAPVFSAELEMVHLVVAVEDGKGRPVPDLRRDDFVVRQDGRIQAIDVCVRAGDSAEDTRLDVNLALLLDVSGSMMEKVSLSRLAALSFLDAVPHAREVLVVLFRHEVRGFRYHPSDREATLRLITETPSSGGTVLYDAIQAALARLGGESGRQIVVLVTDGEDHKSRCTGAQLLEEARRSRATIYPIMVLDALSARTVETVAAESFLERIARTSGGQIFRPADTKGIPAIYDSILRDLSSQYVLGFTSSDHRHDGAYRRLQVRVRRPKMKVRHRDGYFAPKGQS